MYPMKGIKGTSKAYGEKCSRCGTALIARNALHRRPPRTGLLSYCRSCMNQKARIARQKNPESHRNRCKAYREKINQQIFDHYGQKCACCGETAREFLALDHVNGGGAAHRRIMRSSTQLRAWVIRQNFPKTFQILCHNCNSARGWYGYCPHQRS